MKSRPPALPPLPAGSGSPLQPSPRDRNGSTRVVRRCAPPLALCVLLLSGCGDSRRSDAPSANGGTPATPYQTIAPPLFPPRAAATPQAPHWTAAQLPPPADCRLADCRSRFSRAETWVENSRALDTSAWLNAPREFRMGEVWGQVTDWLGTPDRPVAILADNDYQAAGAWLMLRSAGLTSLHVVWGGPPTLAAARWRVAPAAPDDYLPPGTQDAPVLVPPDDPVWLVTDEQFARLTAGLTPVSGRKKGIAFDPTGPGPDLPVDPAANPPPPTTPDNPLTPANSPSLVPNPPAAPAADPPPPPPTTPVEAVDGFIYCGTDVAWQTAAAADRLIQGAVRIPPAEMYREADGSLEDLATRQARLAQLHLDPAKRYLLVGDSGADIAAVCLALDSAGYTHLRVRLP